MTKAQESCKSNSSPGPDGFPVEFYRATWTVTGPILRDVINSIPIEGISAEPSPRNIAHIHLIHKRGEPTLVTPLPKVLYVTFFSLSEHATARGSLIRPKLLGRLTRY
ncbi:BQ2448_328 [Microbotryum intermedium]|uniref:BQ2448_328 protein n=1 Tax=Microbotryum intermedium TaxID=269621 RepID=A0A238F5A8_9BASI|nr:BQ2448_328 [Microbotryum intermedium]